VAADPGSAVAALAALIEELPEDLREQALTHSSWTERRVDSFERLAFLGDSVLGLSVATELLQRFDRVAAGGLTKIHNQAVSGVACAEVGRLLGVPEMLRANEPEDLTAAIPAEVLLEGERPLPEATEALIGACYLAFGFERTAEAVVAAFEPRIEHASETRIDFKSALQELLARRGSRVSYEVIAATGPPHRRTFEVVAIVDSERVGSGEGRSKKAAEQLAAEQALAQLDA
jgi:ribonuclease III